MLSAVPDSPPQDSAASAGVPAVQLAAVEKAYGFFSPRPALRGVSLRIARGECYGLAGPNGAGKTTLLKIMLGLVAPDGGEARLFGLKPESPEVRRRVGFVPEAAELPPGATPLELVKRWARLRGLAARPSFQEGEAHLRRLGMAELLERPVHRFSKGEKQRTLFALALLGGPELLVLDEPTDGLDPLGRALVRRVIQEECAAGRTVFLNSHLLSETERVCSRVGILHRGQLVREERIGREGRHDEQGSSAITLLRELPAEQQAALGLVPGPAQGTWLLQHDGPQALNRALDQLRAAGALLVELRPVRRDLEDSFTEVATAVATPHDQVVAQPALALVESPEPLRTSPLRGVRAAARVAREIASDLIARKLGHVALIGLLLAGGATILALRHDIVLGAASAARQIRLGGAVDESSMAAFLGRNAAAGEYWLWLVGSIFLSALFAPPLLEPRRSTLLLAQPLSRGDLATGIFAAVCGGATLLYVAFGAILYGSLRLLGLPVPTGMLLAPIPAAVAFAAVYAGVLLVTYLWPSGLLAGIFGIASLIGLSIAGNLEAAQPSAAHGPLGFLFGALPKLIGLQQEAMRVGGGGRFHPFPLVSTLVWAMAVLLAVNVIARRSER